jgi:hypothetical protein
LIYPVPRCFSAVEMILTCTAKIAASSRPTGSAFRKSSVQICSWYSLFVKPHERVEWILRRHAVWPEFSVNIVKHDSLSSATFHLKTLRHCLRWLFFRRSVTSTGDRNDVRVPTILDHFFFLNICTIHIPFIGSVPHRRMALPTNRHLSLPVLVVSSQNFIQIGSSVKDIIQTQSHIHNTYIQTRNFSNSTANAFVLNKKNNNRIRSTTSLPLIMRQSHGIRGRWAGSPITFWTDIVIPITARQHFTHKHIFRNELAPLYRSKCSAVTSCLLGLWVSTIKTTGVNN